MKTTEQILALPFLSKYTKFEGFEPCIETSNYKEVDCIADEETVIIIFENFERNQRLFVKMYYDSIAFNGIDYDDEYINFLEPIDADDFTEEAFNRMKKQVAEYIDE